MPNNLPQASFKQIAQNPAVYMLMVAVSLLSYAVYAYTGSNDRSYQDCKEDNIRKEKRIEELTNAILYYRGVNIEIRRQTDSLVLDKVGNEAKKIVE